MISNGPTYLLRLDDASPWHHREKWQQVEDLLNQAGVRPLVGIIPDCKDPDLISFPKDPDFWSRTAGWQAKGWALGLHGFDHRFLTRKGGLVPLNRYSEFAGVSREVQKDKIRMGYGNLKDRGLDPRWWIAPAHSFDRTTLELLRDQTPIRCVSDGLYPTPFRRYGMIWVPQQLWRPRDMKSGVWTLCLHPNEITPGELESLKGFLQRNTGRFGQWQDWEDPDRSIEQFGVHHWFWQAAFLAAKKLKNFPRKISAFLRPQPGVSYQ